MSDHEANQLRLMVYISLALAIATLILHVLHILVGWF